MKEDIIVDALYSLEDKRAALTAIPEYIKTLELEFYTQWAYPGKGDEPADIWHNKQLMQNAATRALLERDLEITRRDVELIDDALSVLTEEERRVIDLFYLHRPRDGLQGIIEVLHVCKATACRMRDNALAKLSKALYEPFAVTISPAWYAAKEGETSEIA